MRANEPDALEIARAQKGDLAAIRIVLEKTSPYVLALCRTWCRPPLEAEDIAQESLVRIARQVSSYSQRSTFFSWVYTLTYRTFLDHARREQRRTKIAPLVPLGDKDFAESQEPLNESADIIHDALSQMDPIYVEVLVLFDIRGFSYAEVAEHLGIPIGTVRSRLARGRVHIRKYLENKGTTANGRDVLQDEGLL